MTDLREFDSPALLVDAMMTMRFHWGFTFKVIPMVTFDRGVVVAEKNRAYGWAPSHQGCPDTSPFYPRTYELLPGFIDPDLGPIEDTRAWVDAAVRLVEATRRPEEQDAVLRRLPGEVLAALILTA